MERLFSEFSKISFGLELLDFRLDPDISHHVERCAPSSRSYRRCLSTRGAITGRLVRVLPRFTGLLTVVVGESEHLAPLLDAARRWEPQERLASCLQPVRAQAVGNRM